MDSRYFYILQEIKSINTLKQAELGVKTGGTFDIDHGRLERRNHAVTDDVSRPVAAHPVWNTIKSIGMVTSIRTIGETATIEYRYYVSSLPADPVVFGSGVRAHWGIENSLHYVLDVAFGEDAYRIKSGNAPENRGFIRKIALSPIRYRIKEKHGKQDQTDGLVGRIS